MKKKKKVITRIGLFGVNKGFMFFFPQDCFDYFCSFVRNELVIFHIIFSLDCIEGNISPTFIDNSDVNDKREMVNDGISIIIPF